MKKKKTTITEIEQYIEFLTKRVESENYKKNVSPEEYEETKEKLSKEKFKLKLLKPKK